MIVHFVAYLPAFAWAIAVIPSAVRREVSAGHVKDELGSVLVMVLTYAGTTFSVALVVAHALGIPWIRAQNDRGRRVAIGGAIAMTAVAMILGAVSWISLLSE
ncbi:MAG: hypothetical protein HOW73_49145 [Polyangiaceae bacterium]|nr:hypothetical protein [Polyangiaceae bacterium]